jgi:superfamily I DNA/RNA helicase
MSDCIEIAKDVLKDSNRNVREVDFDDMVYLPILHNMDLFKYDWIIVDEAQDTNVIRKIMVKRMMKP